MKGQPIGYIAVHRYGGLDENGEPTFMKKGIIPNILIRN